MWIWQRRGQHPVTSLKFKHLQTLRQIQTVKRKAQQRRQDHIRLHRAQQGWRHFDKIGKYQLHVTRQRSGCSCPDISLTDNQNKRLGSAERLWSVRIGRVSKSSFSCRHTHCKQPLTSSSTTGS